MSCFHLNRLRSRHDVRDGGAACSMPPNRATQYATMPADYFYAWGGLPGDRGGPALHALRALRAIRAGEPTTGILAMLGTSIERAFANFGSWYYEVPESINEQAPRAVPSSRCCLCVIIGIPSFEFRCRNVCRVTMANQWRGRRKFPLRPFLVAGLNASSKKLDAIKFHSSRTSASVSRTDLGIPPATPADTAREIHAIASQRTMVRLDPTMSARASACNAPCADSGNRAKSTSGNATRKMRQTAGTRLGGR